MHNWLLRSVYRKIEITSTSNFNVYNQFHKLLPTVQMVISWAWKFLYLDENLVPDFFVPRTLSASFTGRIGVFFLTDNARGRREFLA